MRCQPTIPYIRAAVPGDLAAVVRLDSDCFGDRAWNAGCWADEFDRLGDTRTIMLAETAERTAGADVAGELVGYVVLIVPDHPDDAVDLTRVAVSPAHRRTGIAARLLEAALPTDRNVLLEVAEGNQSARRLYRNTGFTEISRRKGYYPGGEDALLLQRDRSQVAAVEGS